MADDPGVLLIDPRQVAGQVDERDQGDVERVAEPDEPGRFVRGVDVEHPGQDRGLVGHDPDRPTPQPRKAHHDVPRKMGMDLKETAVVHDAPDDLGDIIRLVGAVRNDVIQTHIPPARIVLQGSRWRLFQVVRRQVAEQHAD